MDEYVTYLLAFAILVLISVVVSVSYKYDKDKGSDDGHPPGHSILDVEKLLQSEIDTLRTKIANLTATGDYADHHIYYVEKGNNEIYYTYDDSNKRLFRNSGDATLSNLNSLFSYEAYYHSERLNDFHFVFTDTVILSKGTNTPEGNTALVTYNKKENTISGTSNTGVTRYLRYGKVEGKDNSKNYIYTSTDKGNEKFTINSSGELCLGNLVIRIYFAFLATSLKVSTDPSSTYNNRLIMVSDTNGNIRLRYSQSRENEYKNINNIEYFGITSTKNYPLPYSIPNILGDTDNNNITKLNPFPQTLLSDFGTIRNFGLFAKTNTALPDAASANEETDYFGFTTNLTSDHLKIEYIATHYHSGEIIELPSLWRSSEVKFQNQPYYSIYVIITDDDYLDLYDTTFVDTNSTTGTQTIIIFGSPRSGYKVANKDYGVFLSKDNNIGYADPLVDLITPVKKDDKNRIYKPYGNFNMNALAIMKFNNDGQNHGYGVNTQYGRNGWSITSKPTTGYEEYIPINYGTPNRYQISKADYLNYYRFNANTYTHYFYNNSTTEWETAHPVN